MDALDIFALLVIILLLAVVIWLVVLLGSWPGSIARKRNHPQADAITALGWIGIITATFGALMAVFQEDIKRQVAYSSMGQLGYIVTGIALMRHLGWVSALYMTVNHFLFKGILFVSIAGIVLRTN